MWEEFNVYQLLFANIEVQRRQWGEFHVAKFLSIFDSIYAQNKHRLKRTQLPSQIIDENNYYSNNKVVL